MTRFRLGKSKRLAAFACAWFLMLELVAFPMTQVKAAATAALTAVGFGVTTAAFLAACGIYPYWVDDSSGVNFDWEEWVDDDLMVLVDEYNAANSTTPINPNQVSAFLSGATLLVGNYAWGKLRDFAEWIKMKYAVADNQTGVELGETISAYPVVPYASSPSASFVYENGLQMGQVSGNSRPGLSFIMSSSSASYAFGTNVSALPDSISFNVCSLVPFTAYESKPGYQGARDLVSRSGISVSASSGGRVYIANCEYVNRDSILTTLPILPEASQAHIDMVYEFLAGGQENDFQGITADTSTVSIPDALPEGAEYGGLRVSGLPAATTAESVTDAVQDSVGERLKTPVEVVEVELAPGTEVDSETGVITQNPVVIEAPVQETIPALSALAPSQEFVAAMMEALQTKFPFCLPFDFMRVLQAFVKSPDAPVITMEFHDRIGGGTYTITVDLEPWDDIAAVVRRLESMILFLGFWLNFDKFNVLNIILGQIG